MACSRETLAAEIAGREALARRLGVVVPGDWPPEFYDRPALEYAAKYLEENAESRGWMFWYLLLPEEAGSENDSPILAGMCGFKGKPSVDGTVEIGYSMIPRFQRRGLATEAASALIAWAFSQREVSRVIAETYPRLVPSVRVIEKLGFRPIGAGSEEGVVRYELAREAFERERRR